jgi:hypothetical protein
MRNLLTLSFIIVCLAACKRSSNNLPITPVSLSSQWIRQSSTAMTYTDGKLTNTTSTTFDTNNVGFGNPNIVISFTNNLTGVYSEPGINGFGFNYVISGTQLTYTFDSNANAPITLPTSYTIKKLTSTQLELENGTSAGNGEIVDVVYLKGNQSD